MPRAATKRIMADKHLRPGDPQVVKAVIERIRQMPDEELLQRLRERPDFDESWLQAPPDPKVTTDITVPAKSRRRAVERP